jgi:putative hydrolase of the HAD superfamily
VAGFDACLIDAFGTIVSTDFSGHRADLPVLAGIPADAMYAEFGRLAPALTVGELSMPEVFERILRACGVEPAPALVRALTDKSRELVLATGRLYDDVLPFLRTLRSLGVRTAIVSNCDENARDLLVALGVAALVDALILSCEVKAAKPAPEIYRAALEQLGVTPDATIFVDDNATSCAGAAALGISAVRITRGALDGEAVDGVRSLREVEPMIRARAPGSRAPGSRPPG